MTWVIKGDHDDPFEDHYMTEHTHSECYWSTQQREGKRFTNQGHAYRVAKKWDGRVVRLTPRSTSAVPK
jgi:hypothetical protein